MTTDRDNTIVPDPVPREHNSLCSAGKGSITDECFCQKWAPRVVAPDPVPDTRSWSDGVADSISIVESRVPVAGALGYVPAYLAALDEVLVFLRAMQERGTRRSTSTVDGAPAPDPVPRDRAADLRARMAEALDGLVPPRVSTPAPRDKPRTLIADIPHPVMSPEALRALQDADRRAPIAAAERALLAAYRAQRAADAALTAYDAHHEHADGPGRDALWDALMEARGAHFVAKRALDAADREAAK